MFKKYAKTVLIVLSVFMIAGCISAAEVRYENGCKVEGDYRDGKKNGTWTYYNAAGGKVRQETYRDGVLRGKNCRWDDDGFLLSETNWQAGKRHGKSVEYWITGVLRSEGTFHEGTGKMTGWSLSSKKLSEQEYVNGKEIGQQISWQENGQKGIEYTINKAGKFDGDYIFYRSNGQKAFQFEYNNGKLLKKINFDEMGNKTKEFTFIIGDLNGKSVIRNAPLNSEDGLELMYDRINNQFLPFYSFKGSEPCEYMEIPGKAIITAIKPARAGLNNCPRNPVEVLFDFTPDDPKRSSKCMRDRHLTIGDGKNPSLDFVENRGLKVGQTLCCILKKIITGTCSPRGFDFPDVNLSDYGKWCF